MPEKQPQRKLTEQEKPEAVPRVDLRNEARRGLPDLPRTAEEHYLERKAAVTRQDYAEFLEYQQQKRTATRHDAAE